MSGVAVRRSRASFCEVYGEAGLPFKFLYVVSIPLTPDSSDKFYYVYVLVSEADLDRFYIGTTENPETRIKHHNQGKVPHTSQYRPWKIKNVISFRSKVKALEFEQYLKSHSGRAFAKKHF